MLIVTSIFDPRAKMNFEITFEITFDNDGSKVEEMTKVVKNLLYELYNAYSALCSSFTPSMCSESLPSGSYSGTSFSSLFFESSNTNFFRCIIYIVSSMSSLRSGVFSSI